MTGRARMILAAALAPLLITGAAAAQVRDGRSEQDRRNAERFHRESDRRQAEMARLAQGPFPAEFGDPARISDAAAWLMRREDFARRQPNPRAAMNEGFAGFGAALRAWTMRQPATLDGLRALRAAEIGYRVYWQQHTAATLRQAYAAAHAVFDERRAAIEPALRPAILAELRRTRDMRFIENLFADPQRIAEYRGLLALQRDEDEAVAAATAYRDTSDGSRPPTAGDILRLSDRYNAAHYGLGASGTPGILLHRTALGEAARVRRQIADVQCNRLAVRRYRCAYTLTSEVVGGRDNSLAAALGWLAVLSSRRSSNRWTYIFAYDGRWSSMQMDQAIAAAALVFRRQSAVAAPQPPARTFLDGYNESTQNFMDYPWKW